MQNFALICTFAVIISRLLDYSSYEAMSIGEELFPSQEFFKELDRELDKFSEISDGVKLKSEIWTATAMHEKYENQGENTYDETLAVMEAVYEICEALKELQKKELRAEEQLLELRHFWIITVIKPLLKRKEMEQKKAKREEMERNKLILKLNREIIDLKRKVRQEHIVQQYKDNLFLKAAEDECIEILKCRMNVD